MGPYCKFCNNRCFVRFPEETPQHIINAYRAGFTVGVTIIATCVGGQEFEKKRTGYCYDDILKEIQEVNEND